MYREAPRFLLGRRRRGPPYGYRPGAQGRADGEGRTAGMKRIKPLKKFHIGPRTVKTAAAIIISLVIVNQYGASSAK